ncbi:MAG: twin-arginine translocase TatA/TatE family subunit [Methanobacteriota archaeon]|nr:MAG: twin-arginine translocase TatA/TatE family subunit [Euryarchaeota archaeon]
MTTGGTELLVVLAIAVILFGPKKLPELARTLGQAVGEYHRAQREFEAEVRKTSTAIDREISSVTAAEPRMAAPKAQAPGPVEAPQKPSSPPAASREVREIARNLGIDTANKTDSQLLREISLKTKSGGGAKEPAAGVKHKV